RGALLQSSLGRDRVAGVHLRLADPLLVSPQAPDGAAAHPAQGARGHPLFRLDLHIRRARARRLPVPRPGDRPPPPRQGGPDPRGLLRPLRAQPPPVPPDLQSRPPPGQVATPRPDRARAARSSPPPCSISRWAPSTPSACS